MSNTERARHARIAALSYDFDRQQTQHVISCNLCGYRRFVTLSHSDRYGYTAQASGCQRCGLVFLDPVMTAAAYRDFYCGVYRPLVSAFHGRTIDAETIQDEAYGYAVDLSKFLRPHLERASPTTLLDIGGSTGVVTAHLATCFDLQATVLDPSPDELRLAKSRGLATIYGLVEDLDLAGSSYELITLCQTVDHLLDVSGTLETIGRILAHKGLFFVDIVDFRAAYLRNSSVEMAIKIDHPFFLTEVTMEAYLARAGFEVLRKNYAADHLHVGYLCCLGDVDRQQLPSCRFVEEQWREIRAIQNRTTCDSPNPNG